jgi:hypothetical protein
MLPEEIDTVCTIESISYFRDIIEELCLYYLYPIQGVHKIALQFKKFASITPIHFHTGSSVDANGKIGSLYQPICWHMPPSADTFFILFDRDFIYCSPTEAAYYVFQIVVQILAIFDDLDIFADLEIDSELVSEYDYRFDELFELSPVMLNFYRLIDLNSNGSYYQINEFYFRNRLSNGMKDDEQYDNLHYMVNEYIVPVAFRKPYKPR